MYIIQLNILQCLERFKLALFSYGLYEIDCSSDFLRICLVFLKADEPWRNEIVQNTRVSNDVLQLKKSKHNRRYLHHDSEYLLSMLTMTFK